jgi:DNA-binding NarL/FixJ family response regulator
MDRMLTAVWSRDPLTAEGIRVLLRSVADIEPVTFDRIEDARVAVIADVALTAYANAVLERAAASTARVLLVVDELTDVEPTALAAGRVVGVLCRLTLDGATLTGAVRAAAVAEPVNWKNLLRSKENHHTTRVALGPRERELLTLFAAGLSTAEAAREFACSERSVKNMVRRLVDRLGVRNRTHAVAFAIQHSLI